MACLLLRFQNIKRARKKNYDWNENGQKPCRHSFFLGNSGPRLRWLNEKNACSLRRKCLEKAIMTGLIWIIVRPRFTRTHLHNSWNISKRDDSKDKECRSLRGEKRPLCVWQPSFHSSNCKASRLEVNIGHEGFLRRTYDRVSKERGRYHDTCLL